MSTLNGLPAHILLVHAIVVLLPLSALLLVLCVAWGKARRALAGPNALLAAFALILVPITTDAGEWLERRVTRSSLLQAHTELGDTALYVAIPVAVLALVVWWRQRESTAAARPAASDADDSPKVAPAAKSVGRRAFLAPASRPVTTVIAVLAVLAAGGACYQVYRIGDSGARATWQDQFSTEPAPPGGR
ncbi:DUF2231 domain-containing protein [Actinokineospora sp. NBRC 105648]|uniref:DUF2231 domain-containing protein n=1 Tax=Actinokineospora sp. NBRC 105648 TaxID=3032206 RepID=UPI0025529CC9|nr:DUF2231 domain-containing protein [Actinokineospora sp. NBRC 105648]